MSWETFLNAIFHNAEMRRRDEQYRKRTRRFGRIRRKVAQAEAQQQAAEAKEETVMLARIVQATLAKFEASDTLTKSEFETILEEAREHTSENERR